MAAVQDGRGPSFAPLGALVKNGPDEVEAGSGSQQRGDFGGIVRRRDLDKVGADDLEPPGDLAQDLLAFVVAEAAVADLAVPGAIDGSKLSMSIET